MAADRNVCVVCGRIVKDSDNGIGCEGPCQRWFHAACAKVDKDRYQKLAKNTKLTWACERDDCIPPPNLSELMDKINNMQREFDNKLKKAISELERKFSEEVEKVIREKEEIKLAVEFMSEDFEKMKKDQHKGKKDNDIDEYNNVGPKILQIEQEQEDMQQYARRNNLKITGVPVKNQEDTYDIVIGIASKAGVKVSYNDLDAVHRLPTKDKSRPAPIIAKFNNRWIKESIMDGLYTKRIRLNTHDIGSPWTDGQNTPVYVNDHLTTRNEHLAKLARDMKRAKKCIGTWTRDCKIYIKKDTSSKGKWVRSEADLK